MDRGCQHWRLSAYLDGELSAEEAVQVEQHLAACAECRARLRALERITVTLRQARPLVPPPTPAHSAALPAARGRRVWRWALACGLGAAVALGVRAGMVRQPAAAAARPSQVRATVDFRNNQVVTVVSWSRDREPGR